MTGINYQEFEAFIGRHHRQLVAFFIRRGCGKPEAQDLAQDTWIRAFNHWESYRGEGKLEGWIARIALRVLLNHRRNAGAKKRPQLGPTIDELAAEGFVPALLVDEETPLELMLGQEARGRVLEAFRKLPGKEKRCMELWCLGHSYREIGEAVGLTYQSVKTYIYQAKLQLREDLGARDPSGTPAEGPTA